MHLSLTMQGFDFKAKSRGWLRWKASRPRKLTCPACKNTSQMTSRMDTSSPAHNFRRFALYECSHCQSGFFAGLKPPAYEGKAAKTGERIRETAALKYYLEQGAGILSMITPLLGVSGITTSSRTARHLLEVGCGYGLSLHFAKETLGWKVTGCDPSSLARVGAEDLNLPIAPVYLEADTKLEDAPFDVVYSSEVIEHVADPDGFLLPLKNAISENGTLILTTPAIEGINENRSLDSMLPLVSPGSHLILFSESGLQATLARAGFSNITVIRNGDTLYAWASLGDRSNPAEPPSQALYLKYLQQQSKRFSRHEQLFTGFAGRWLKELGNAGRYEQAAPVLKKIGKHFRKLYGIDLDAPDLIKLPNPEQIDFEEFANSVPLNLPVILYHAGVYALNADKNPKQAARCFTACIACSEVFQNAFRKVNVIDLEFLLIGGLAQALTIGLLASEQVEKADSAMDQHPASNYPDDCRPAFFAAQMDVFSVAANTGKWDIANKHASQMGAHLQQKSSLDARERSAAAGLAMLALNHAYDRKTGLFWLQRALLDAPKCAPWTQLRDVWADQAYARAVELLVEGGQKALAAALGEIEDGLMVRPAIETDLDVLIALGHIFQRNDPQRALVWFLRANSVANAKTRSDLNGLIAVCERSSFLQAVAKNHMAQAKALRPAMDKQAKEAISSPGLCLALGLDDLNRSADPVSARTWLVAAMEADDQQTSNSAQTALKIAEAQIQIMIVEASAGARYQQVLKLQEHLPQTGLQPETCYALAMVCLNETSEYAKAAEGFAETARICSQGSLHDLALFHQALCLGKAGKAKQATSIKDKLFAGKIDPDLRKRESELQFKNNTRAKQQ